MIYNDENLNLRVNGNNKIQMLKNLSCSWTWTRGLLGVDTIDVVKQILMSANTKKSRSSILTSYVNANLPAATPSGEYC